MENVRAIAFTERDIEILFDEYEYQHRGEYCVMKYGLRAMVEIYRSQDYRPQNILVQMDFVDFLEQQHPFFNINFDNAIAIYDDFIDWRKDIAILVLKNINYKMV